MLKIKLTERAQREWSEWVKADRKKAEKIEELIREIAKKPYAGRGKPEALKHELSGCWSRRIS